MREPRDKGNRMKRRRNQSMRGLRDQSMREPIYEGTNGRGEPVIRESGNQEMRGTSGGRNNGTVSSTC